MALDWRKCGRWRKQTVAIRIALVARCCAIAIYCRVGEEQKGREGGRLCFTGSASAIVDDIGHAQDRGLQHFLIGGDGGDLQETEDRLEKFATDVMSQF